MTILWLPILAQKIFVEIDAEVDKAFPHQTGAKLEVRFKNGEILRDYQEDIHPLDMEEVVARFKNHAKAFMEDAQADEIIDKTLNIESLHSIGDLMDLLEADL